MKETIYTIPINDAFDTACACPLCTIYERLDQEAVEYALGASMMEPDSRIISNEKGYCTNHYHALLTQSKALPLGLVLQTHLEEQLKALRKDLKKSGPKAGLFKSSSAKTAALSAAAHLKERTTTCAICDKLAAQMARYIDNTVFLWKTEPDFQTKFAARDGFCFPHFAALIECASKTLNDKQFDEFYQLLCQMELRQTETMYQDLCAFVKMFDYNGDKNPSPSVKSAIRRTISLLAGAGFIEEK